MSALFLTFIFVLLIAACVGAMLVGSVTHLSHQTKEGTRQILERMNQSNPDTKKNP